jgi:type IV secretory pathway TraG/TraD family ATPase VirD4
MSEGGGTGISTLVVLQSLAQARAVWGEHQAGAIWDSAIVKVILGGGSNARDLDDLSNLIGHRQQRQTSTSTGPDGRTTTSTSEREVRVMEPSRLRTPALRHRCAAAALGPTHRPDVGAVGGSQGLPRASGQRARP